MDIPKAAKTGISGNLGLSSVRHFRFSDRESSLNRMRGVIPKVGFVIAASLFGYLFFEASLYFAASAGYQVAECRTISFARAITSGQMDQHDPKVSLFFIFLAKLIRSGSTSVELFSLSRLIAFLLFWTNVVLVGTATGVRLFSKRWLMAMAGAVTLAPLWNFGLAIGPQNLLLTELLLMWCLIRFQNTWIISFYVLGLLIILTECTVRGAFAYSIPLSLAGLLSLPAKKPGGHLRLLVAMMLGAVTAFLIIHFFFGSAWIWNFPGGIAAPPWGSTNGRGGFNLGKISTGCLIRMPLFFAVLIAASISLGADVLRRGKLALHSNELFPESLMVLTSFVIMLASPLSNESNVVVFLSFSYLLAFRYAVSVFDHNATLNPARALLVSLVVFGHFVPFMIAIQTDLKWSNTRQEALMSLAEDATNPNSDSVFDGVGLVPTRVNFETSGSFSAHKAAEKARSSIQEIFGGRPAAVIIPSYRTDWLPELDHAYIDAHYVSVADDFMVLGKVLPGGDSSFDIIHAGRYRISTWEASDLKGSYPDGMAGMMTPEQDGKLNGFLDGKPINDQVVELSVGTHQLKTISNGQVAVVWVGPQKNRIHRIGTGDHRRTFVNWY